MDCRIDRWMCRVGRVLGESWDPKWAQKPDLHSDFPFLLLPAASTLVGLLVFPATLASPFAKEVCKGSSMYHSGTCWLSWGYAMAILNVVLTSLLVIRWQTTPVQRVAVPFSSDTQGVILVPE